MFKPKSVIRTTNGFYFNFWFVFSSVLALYLPSCFPYRLDIARYAFDNTVAI